MNAKIKGERSSSSEQPSGLTDLEMLYVVLIRAHWNIYT